MPPTFRKSEANVAKLEMFSKSSGLGHRLAVEFRDLSWFSKETIELAKKLGITLVSIDSPIATWIASSNNIVYLRLHGRMEWYSYEYSDEELKELATKIIDLNPKKVYVFFNNNHWMLENARKMLSFLLEKITSF